MPYGPASSLTPPPRPRRPAVPGVGRAQARVGHPHTHACTMLAAVLVFLGSLLCSPCAGAQAPRSALRMLVVSQVATADASTVSARIGTLAFSAAGLATDRLAEALPNASGIAQASVRDFGNGLTQAQLLSAATAHLLPQAPALAAGLAAVLRARGLGQATFVFDQQVTVAGTARPRRLVWTISVDRAGRASHGEPRLFDDRPHILHVQYVPLRVAAGLPAGWAYPDAGWLRWQRLDLQLQPSGPAGAIDTGGAFDAPDALDGQPVDPEAGVRCLVDRRSRIDCPQGLTDVVTLIDEQGSASALLDYGLRLAPVYDAVPSGSGRFEQVARLSLSVDRREVSYGGCTSDMRLRNAGRYGYTLAASNDRYAVAPDGRFSRIDRTTTTVLSPTIAYDWTRTLRPTAVAALAPLILDPHDPSRPLLEASSIANLVHLAPITASGEQEQTVGSFMPTSYDQGRVQVELRCSIDGTWTVRSMIVPWARCLSGSCNSTYLPYEATFIAGQRSIAPPRLTAVLYDGRPWEAQQAEYDGAMTVTIWHDDACRGGRIGTQLSLDGRHSGLVGVSSC